jgi:phosphatidylserine/phosphatidylglycerophosphate/cardiolipin synthase-like enzyme/N-acetylmuramoyl-L-alanine amidase
VTGCARGAAGGGAGALGTVLARYRSMPPKILIDPGHGGQGRAGRSSALGVAWPSGLREKDLTLRLARRLASHLAPRATLTRHRDMNLSLAARTEQSRRLGAPVFLSLHAGRGYGGNRVMVHPHAGASSLALARSVGGELGARVETAEMAVLHPAWHARDAAACLVELDLDDERASTLDERALDALSRAIARGASRPVRRLYGRGPLSARQLSAEQAPACPSWLAGDASTDYFRYVRPPTLGLATPLINGRSSGGSGPDDDLTEPLDAMQNAVAAAGAGDFIYFSAWWFMPSTPLTAGTYGAATTWGALFAAKASEGVKIRILINDFDDIPGKTTMGANIQATSIAPLDLIIAGLPADRRDNLKYVVSLHPAHVGGLKSLLAGLGWRDTYVASHHQKFMVVKRGDSLTAFCGGLDIERRKTPAAWSYTGLVGWHDVHVQLEGPITRDLEQEFVMRWNREKGSSRRAALAGWAGYEALRQTPLSATDDRPEKKAHQMQMLRTISQDATFSPYSTERDDVKQVYRRAIACATSFIYLENQYFRSTELADWIVAAGTANPALVVIIVVLEDASADDGSNPVTAHGDWLQYTTLKRIMDGLGARARLYTMKGRSVHAKFMLIDDAWMTIGSANANVRSFELDSELNLQLSGGALVGDFRTRLWSHNLGVDPALVGGWAVGNFLAQWDAVATANDPLALTEMTGEGIVPYDYNSRPGAKSSMIPDALAELDVSPEVDTPAGPVPPLDDDGATATA